MQMLFKMIFNHLKEQLLNINSNKYQCKKMAEKEMDIYIFEFRFEFDGQWFQMLNFWKLIYYYQKSN